MFLNLLLLPVFDLRLLLNKSLLLLRLSNLKKIFENLGSKEGSTKVQGGFVIEKAFAEK